LPLPCQLPAAVWSWRTMPSSFAVMDPVPEPLSAQSKSSLEVPAAELAEDELCWAGAASPETSRTDAANLAYLLTDSIGSLNTPYWIDSQKNKDAGIPGWQDITTEANRYRSTISKDMCSECSPVVSTKCGVQLLRNSASPGFITSSA